jgi:hypothetical protein
MPSCREDLAKVALAAVALACAIVLSAPAGARANAFLPPPGQVWTGVAGGLAAETYGTSVGHPAVFQQFATWGTRNEWFFSRAEAARSRLMIHISTIRQPQGKGEVISPGAIAGGGDDGWLLWLGDRIAQRGRPVYVRPMSEMNAYWNPYSAYDRSGRSRGPAHSTAAYKRAWKRIVLILRGGDVAAIDAKLRKLRMPPVATSAGSLPAAPVSFQWVPQVAGSPDTARNSPRAYWPGSAYVDWVGTDFYSKFPNWAGLSRLYRQFRGKPFAFGEWAMWGADNPGFVQHLFSWSRSHARSRMLIYNQGYVAGGIFRLNRYPRSAAVLRREMSSRRYPAFAPEWLP